MNWIRSGREMVAWGNGYSCCGVQGVGQTRVRGTWFVGKGWEEGSSTMPLFRMDCNGGMVLFSPYGMQVFRLTSLFLHHIRLVEGPKQTFYRNMLQCKKKLTKCTQY